MADVVIVPQSGLSSVTLDKKRQLKRNPPRPPALRQPGYEDLFDFHTVFFDCYRLKSGVTRFQGPPPLNLRGPLELSQLRLGNTEARVKDYPEACLERLRRTFRLDINAAGSSDVFQLAMKNGQTFNGRINENLSHLFADRRVLMTMVKYDPLEWIAQWVEFFVKAHGVDGILIFNNNATRYSSKELAEALKVQANVKTIVVVDWFFPYGPGAGESGKWDSAYAQVGAMEYARYRFLEDARCVVNADIDELVFSRHANQTLCEITEASHTGYTEYRAMWAGGMQGPDISVPEVERRYASSCYVNKAISESGSKWSVVPAMCASHIEWGVHRIPKMDIDERANSQLCYRNFLEFNTGWKAQRDFGVGDFVLDGDMRRTYRSIGWETKPSV